MKNSMLSILMMLTAIIFSTTSCAQSESTDISSKKEDAKEMLNSLAEELELTGEKKKEFIQANAEFYKSVKKIGKDKQKRKELRDQHQVKMKSMLGEEKYKVYLESVKKERKERKK